MSSKQSILIEKSFIDCRVESVTIFSDRAEVTRKVTFNPTKLGDHCVKLIGLSFLIDPNSVCLKATHTCKIQEVGHDVVSSDKFKTESSVNEDIRKQIDILKLKSTDIQQKVTVLNTQKELVQKYAQTSMTLSDGKSILNITDAVNIMKFHSDSIQDLNSQINELDQVFVNIIKDINSLEFELNKSSSVACDQKSRILFLSVEVVHLEQIDLTLSYMISSASWTPSYDIRINSKENQMSLTYYVSIGVDRCQSLLN